MLAGTSRGGEMVAGWMVTSRCYFPESGRKCHEIRPNSCRSYHFPRDVSEGVTSKTIGIRSPKGGGEMAEGDWWFDLKTHTVVPDNNDTKITDRLGPYKTREEAERALERVEERNEEYDNDPRWNDDLLSSEVQPLHSFLKVC